MLSNTRRLVETIETNELQRLTVRQGSFIRRPVSAMWRKLFYIVRTIYNSSGRIIILSGRYTNSSGYILIRPDDILICPDKLIYRPDDISWQYNQSCAAIFYKWNAERMPCFHPATFIQAKHCPQGQGLLFVNLHALVKYSTLGIWIFALIRSHKDKLRIQRL